MQHVGSGGCPVRESGGGGPVLRRADVERRAPDGNAIDIEVAYAVVQFGSGEVQNADIVIT